MDKLWEDSDYRAARFACDCFDAEHSLTVSIERGKGPVFVCLSQGLQPHGLRSRLRHAWRSLRGKFSCQAGEFILRSEDLPHLVTLLSQDSNTSTGGAVLATTWKCPKGETESGP
jgi:hypothetical protein